MAGFESSAADAGALALHAGSVSAVAREEAEMKTAIVLARANPRNELDCYNRLLKSCCRASFADKSLYSFPRGDKLVEGPSVWMAREAARIWGNIRSGLRVVTADDTTVHIKGYAYDLQSNTYVETEDRFSKLIQRKDRKTGEVRWLKPDERDLRELINRRGAICVRNAILQLLPADVIEDAVVQSNETLAKAADGDLKADRETTIRRLVMAFSEHQVNTEMLAAHLGHPIELLTDTELARLRMIYTAIKDGQATRDDYFVVPGAAQETIGKTVGGIMDAIHGVKINKSHVAATEPAPKPAPEPAADTPRHQEVREQAAKIEAATPATGGEDLSFLNKPETVERGPKRRGT